MQTYSLRFSALQSRLTLRILKLRHGCLRQLLVQFLVIAHHYVICFNLVVTIASLLLHLFLVGVEGASSARSSALGRLHFLLPPFLFFYNV